MYILNKYLKKHCTNLFNVKILSCDSLLDNSNRLRNVYYKDDGSNIHLSKWGIAIMVTIIKTQIHGPRRPKQPPSSSQSTHRTSNGLNPGNRVDGRRYAAVAGQGRGGRQGW